MNIHHIGYAVSDIKKSICEFEKIGFKNAGELYIDNKRNVSIQLMKSNKLLIELISPNNKYSPVQNIIKRNGNTPYHLCFCTENIALKIKELRKNKYTLIESPNPAIAFNNRLVAFLYNKDIGIIELLEGK